MWIWTSTPAPGTKRCRPCASWRPWGALTGANGVSADSLGLPDDEFFIGWYMPAQPQHQGPEGVSHVPPGGLGEHLQGQMGYQQIRWDSQIKNFLLVGTCHPQPQHQGPEGVGHVPPRGLGEHLQWQIGYQQIRWDFQMKIFYWLVYATPNPGTRD